MMDSKTRAAVISIKITADHKGIIGISMLAAAEGGLIREIGY